MLFFLVFLIFPIGIEAIQTQKLMMVSMSGAYNTYTLMEWCTGVFEDCLTTCINAKDCVAVWRRLPSQNYMLFKYDWIPSGKRLNSTEGQTLAIKTPMDSDTCPPISEGPPFFGRESFSWEYFSGEDVRVTTVTPTETGWAFNYTRRYCPENTQYFYRNETIGVCVGVYVFGFCGLYTDAVAGCETMNGMLTGPASQDEFDYMKNITTTSYITSHGCATECQGKTNIVILDGYNDPDATIYTFQDPTHDGYNQYPMDGTPQTDTAQLTFYMPTSNQKIGNYPATEQPPNGECYSAAMCRVDP